MSHTTRISKVKVKDIAALKMAVQSLQKEGVDCELVEKSKCRLYSNRQTDDLGVLDYVLKLKNSPYDVGFEKMEDGTYQVTTDEYAGHVAKQIGVKGGANQGADAIGRLMQHYSTNAAVNAAQEAGYTLKNMFTDENGVVQLEVEVQENQFGYDTGANYGG